MFFFGVKEMNGKNCCGFISCVCKILAEHAVDCKYRISATCAVPIECEHGCDVCSYCDACTCKKM